MCCVLFDFVKSLFSPKYNRNVPTKSEIDAAPLVRFPRCRHRPPTAQPQWKRYERNREKKRQNAYSTRSNLSFEPRPAQTHFNPEKYKKTGQAAVDKELKEMKRRQREDLSSKNHFLYKEISGSQCSSAKSYPREYPANFSPELCERARKFGRLKIDPKKLKKKAPPTRKRKPVSADIYSDDWRDTPHVNLRKLGYQSYAHRERAQKYFVDLADITDWLDSDLSKARDEVTRKEKRDERLAKAVLPPEPRPVEATSRLWRVPGAFPRLPDERQFRPRFEAGRDRSSGSSQFGGSLREMNVSGEGGTGRRKGHQTIGSSFSRKTWP